MLKQRLITAIILIPLFVALLLKLPPIGFNCLLLAFVLIGAWEWSSLMGLKLFVLRCLYPAFIFLLLAVFPFIAKFMPIILMSAVVFWLLALILVLIYPRASSLWGESIFLRGLMGVMVLIPTFDALQFLRNTQLFGDGRGPYILLYLFILIWGADSGAYFAGKAWGKNKLAPRVSPGKTWQGLAGALFLTVLIAPLLLYFFPKPLPSLWMIEVLALITTLFSVLGDLFESMLKRNVNIKDSGKLFPGHGGLMDRIDSLTAAAPLFALGCLFLFKILH
jgi:phosphatidate cytidylyltransferase